MLIQVGAFFSDLVATKALDVRTLPLVGFEFIQNYFLGVNENQKNLVRFKKEKRKKPAPINMYTLSIGIAFRDPEPEPEEDDEVPFKVVINPL